jgi:hypothetical protein
MNQLEMIIENYSEETFLIADGFDEAVIGFEAKSGRLIYSSKKCLEILVEEGMSHEDALEHFEYNVTGSYVGEQTPIFMETVDFF